MDVLRDLQLDPWVLKDVLIIIVIEAPRPASRKPKLRTSVCKRYRVYCNLYHSLLELVLLVSCAPRDSCTGPKTKSKTQIRRAV